jgi:hypothetical protein
MSINCHPATAFDFFSAMYFFIARRLFFLLRLYEFFRASCFMLILLVRRDKPAGCLRMGVPYGEGLAATPDWSHAWLSGDDLGPGGLIFRIVTFSLPVCSRERVQITQRVSDIYSLPTLDSVIRGGDFRTRKNRLLPRMRFGQERFSKRSGQGEERIPRNQLAVFRLWLRRVPERLYGGRDERRETTRKSSDFYVWPLSG